MGNARTHGKQLLQEKEQGRRAQIQRGVMARRMVRAQLEAQALKEKMRQAGSAIANWIENGLV